MSETPPVYRVTNEVAGPLPVNGRLPARAWNLAMRILQLEAECDRRGRLTLDIIFLDGEWLLGVQKPAALERLGE